MRILSVHNRYLIGGGEDNSTAAENALLEQHGHMVECYTQANERVAELGVARTAVRTVWSQETYREVRRLLRAGGFDVVSCQNTFPLISPSVYYAAHAEGVPVVQTLRNYRLLCPNAYLFRNERSCESCLGKLFPWPGVQHACYRGSKAASLVLAGMLAAHRLMGTYREQVDVYVALTEFARRKFIEGGLPAERITVKPNFIDPDPGMGPGDGGYVLFVGRLSDEKGLAILLEAWRRLAVPLKIAGEGPLQPLVEGACALNPVIEYLGRRSGPEVFELMGRAQALVFPSQWYEGMPRTILEAYAKGTPVLATRLGAMETLVEHDRTGRHFSPGDAPDLARQVEWMAAHPTEWAAMRQEARRTYEARFTARANYERTVQIFERAIALRRGPEPSLA